MKICIIALVLVFVYTSAAPSEQRRAELTALVSACAKDTKVEQKDLNDYHEGKMPAEKVPETVKCFTKCFMEKMGIIDPKTSEFSPESLKKKFAKYINDGNRKELDDALVKCNAVKGTTPCDTAFQISSCMSKVKMQVDD